MATITTTTTRVVAFAALVLALACHGMSAQSLAPESASAPSPAGVDCFTALTNVSDCLTFVEAGSNLTKPDKGCCPEFAGLIESNPICLCQLLGKPDFVGIKINLNKAIKLPSVCGVDTPPVSTCSVIGVPVSLPPSSEGLAPGGSATSPSNAPSSGGPSPSSDEAAVGTSGNKNGASGIQAFSLPTFIFALSTLFVSTFF
ncbi:non-specific lipid transfer protein GPI-anchored 12-like [Lotus japonicus]|uniref:Bifunctional inhibitor/plant lipid transfer protein/seed storage helical domain-containing protein n=1 Tax=Lotus japonicus TaxID=34305 RepID=I3SPE8_LOTJA|nr:non-specific lipid transfer protein GPI-anchored 12-like [Lotus japonicus]AFK42140.1 unknown [Lotus japonicus]